MDGTTYSRNGLLRSVTPILYFLLVQFGWPIAGMFAVVAARSKSTPLAATALALAAASLSFVVEAMLLRLEQVDRAAWRDHFRLAVLLYAATALAAAQALYAYAAVGQGLAAFLFLAVWEFGALAGSAACVSWSARKQIFENELSNQRRMLAPRQSGLPTAIGVVATVVLLSIATVFGRYFYLLPFFIGVDR